MLTFLTENSHHLWTEGVSPEQLPDVGEFVGLGLLQQVVLDAVHCINIVILHPDTAKTISFIERMLLRIWHLLYIKV